MGKFRSRMQVVFTIRTGSGRDHELVEKFLSEANDDLGWLDIRSHPLGTPSDAIRVTMYNHQTEDTVQIVREFMHDFQKRNDFQVSAPSKDLLTDSASPAFHQLSTSVAAHRAAHFLHVHVFVYCACVRLCTFSMRRKQHDIDPNSYCEVLMHSLGHGGVSLHHDFTSAEVGITLDVCSRW